MKLFVQPLAPSAEGAVSEADWGRGLSATAFQRCRQDCFLSLRPALRARQQRLRCAPIIRGRQGGRANFIRLAPSAEGAVSEADWGRGPSPLHSSGADRDVFSPSVRCFAPATSLIRGRQDSPQSSLFHNMENPFLTKNFYFSPSTTRRMIWATPYSSLEGAICFP